MYEPNQIQDAAVLVPVFRANGGELRLLIVRRTEHGVHGGQLAFPGGKRDAGDPSFLHTALREAREEVGIDEETVVVLEELPMVDTISTGFHIYPFLACIQPQDPWEIDTREVSEVLEVPLAHLARPEAHHESIERFPEWPDPVRVPYYKVGPHRLWGASYRIVTPLITRLLAGDWAI